MLKVTSKNHLLLGFVLENRILGILGEEKNRPQKSWYTDVLLDASPISHPKDISVKKWGHFMSINCRVVEARIKIASLKVMQFGYRQPNKTFNFHFRVRWNWSIFHHLIYKWSHLDLWLFKRFLQVMDSKKCHHFSSLSEF